MTHALLEELPAAHRLALAYAPRSAREATLAVLALDARLAAVLRRRGEPVLAQVRFAWWRDTLGSKKAQWPRGDEVLGLLGGWGEPAALIALVDGWEGLLSEDLEADVIDGFAAGRGQAFAQLAAELGAVPSAADLCGRVWALADLAANLSGQEERQTVLAAAKALPPCGQLPRTLRPLAVLAALGQRSIARGGAPLFEGPRAILFAVRVGILGR
jgi:phytoene synthase